MMKKSTFQKKGNGDFLAAGKASFYNISERKMEAIIHSRAIFMASGFVPLLTAGWSPQPVL